MTRLVQLVRLYFTVKRVTRDAHSDFADLRHSCTSAEHILPVAVEVGTTVKLPQTLALKQGVRVEETASCEGPTKAASDGSRAGARSPRYDSNWKLCRRCYECTEPFSKHIRTAQTVLANKYAEHWCSLPESKEMWCGALAAEDDTVSCIEILTDGSSLIPKAWPRVAASGGWRVLVSAICYNQRIIRVHHMFLVQSSPHQSDYLTLRRGCHRVTA